MKTGLIVLTLVALAGCGANGAPVRPTTSANVSIGTDGVSAGTNIGVTNGFLSLNLGQSLFRD